MMMKSIVYHMARKFGLYSVEKHDVSTRGLNVEVYL